MHHMPALRSEDESMIGHLRTDFLRFEGDGHCLLLIGGSQLLLHGRADGFYEQVLVKEAHFLFGGMQIYVNMVSRESQVLLKIVD